MKALRIIRELTDQPKEGAIERYNRAIAADLERRASEDTDHPGHRRVLYYAVFNGEWPYVVATYNNGDTRVWNCNDSGYCSARSRAMRWLNQRH